MKKMLFGVLIATISASASAETFTFSPTVSVFPFSWHVVFDGGMSLENPTLHVTRGQTYDFIVKGNSSHPFYVKTVSSTGSANAYEGFMPNPVQTSTTQTVSFLVPQDAPDTLFYNCFFHSTMAGQIDVSIFRDSFD